MFSILECKTENSISSSSVDVVIGTRYVDDLEPLQKSGDNMTIEIDLGVALKFIFDSHVEVNDITVTGYNVKSITVIVLSLSGSPSTVRMKSNQ